MPKNREAGGMSVKNEAGHEEIKDFFGRHGQFLEKYAGDSSIRIEPSPKGLGTFAIDLENGRLFAEPSRFGDKGWGEDKILSSVLHEFEHFREFKELLDEKGGWEVYQRYKQKLAANRRFGILDNSFDDVKIDRRVGERAPILNGAIKRKYREDLFPVLDYTDQPKHLQFAYALKRRGKLPDEVIKLSPEVQAELDKLDVIASRGVKLLDYASRPDTPMSMRLDLQERFLEPAYERLFEQDVKEKEDQDKKDGGQGSGEGAEGDEGGEPGEEDGEPKGAKNKPKGKAKKSDKKPDGDKHAGPSGMIQMQEAPQTENLMGRAQGNPLWRRTLSAFHWSSGCF